MEILMFILLFFGLVLFAYVIDCSYNCVWDFFECLIKRIKDTINK